MNRLFALARGPLRTRGRWSILEDDTKAYLARILVNDMMIVLGRELGVSHGDLLQDAAASHQAAQVA